MPKRSLELGGQTETPVLKRVDFEKFMAAKGNGNRPLDIVAMEQMQDSLIARRYNLPQRLAILATAAQEMGAEGAASRGVGGNGYLGLSEQRMPLSYLGNTPKKRGEQIHYLLEDLNKVHSDNWHHGGNGGISIKTGQEGFDKFWSEPNVWNATQILNKSYIRPRDRQAAWDNRSTVAKNMQKYLYENGGIISTPIRREDIRPSLANGGGIYIKPSHRGRLTELKARTGKTESELYNDGNPAHKKMVVFARNARKWNH